MKKEKRKRKAIGDGRPNQILKSKTPFKYPTQVLGIQELQLLPSHYHEPASKGGARIWARKSNVECGYLKRTLNQQTPAPPPNEF